MGKIRTDLEIIQRQITRSELRIERNRRWLRMHPAEQQNSLLNHLQVVIGTGQTSQHFLDQHPYIYPPLDLSEIELED